MRRLIYRLLLVSIFCLAVRTAAFADPTVNGFVEDNEYSGEISVGWYNDHHTESFHEGGQTATLYHQTVGNMFYLGLVAPLNAKNMIWGSGWTIEEATLYYKNFSNHHDETLAEYFAEKGDFKHMTESEKVKFGEITKKTKIKHGKTKVKVSGSIQADLDGGVSGANEIGTLKEYKDSVDYVIAENLGDRDDSAAANIPMAFEFKFQVVSQDDIDDFLDLYIYDAVHNPIPEKIVYHLSPERGGSVPEPSLGLLLGISLVGLVGVGTVRKIKQKKVANI